ncbi:MAG: hypothetical protein DMG81_11115, partial [Acidobacteria bacterium]
DLHALGGWLTGVKACGRRMATRKGYRQTTYLGVAVNRVHTVRKRTFVGSGEDRFRIWFVLDLAMPQLNGLRAASEIRKASSFLAGFGAKCAIVDDIPPSSSRDIQVHDLSPSKKL